MSVALLPMSVELGAALILCAVVLDWIDGWVARLLRASSEFGRELDSISDVVCFGVAPAALVFRSSLGLLEVPALGLGAVLVFAAAGAVRLARFNVWTGADDVDHTKSMGLTVPMAACVSVGCALVGLPPAWLMVAQVVLAVLMLSMFPYRTFKGFVPTVRSVGVVGCMVAAVVAVGVAASWLSALLVAAGGYAVSGPLEALVKRVARGASPPDA